MAKANGRIGHESLDAMLSVTDLLEASQLAHIYAYLFRHGPATAEDVRNELDMAQTTIILI